jgi:cytochrome c556
MRRGRASWAAVGLAVVAAGVLGATGIALAQSGNAAELVKARQQAFKRLGAALKLIHSEVREASPDVAKIGSAATEVKSAASHLAEWFPPGTGPQAGLKTHAKAEIWTDERGFAAARAEFIRQVDKSTRQLTDPGERGSWKDAAAALGQTCRDCHDSYRVQAD